MAVHRGSVSAVHQVSRKPWRRPAQPQLQRSRRQSRTRSCSRHCIRNFFCNGGFGTPSAVTSCAALACAAPRVPLVYTAIRVQARMPGRTLWTLPGWPAAPVGGASADATTGPVGPRQRRRGEPQCPAPPSGSLPFVFVASSFWCRSPRPRRSRGALTASSNGAVLAAGVRCREAPRRQRPAPWVEARTFCISERTRPAQCTICGTLPRGVGMVRANVESVSFIS